MCPIARQVCEQPLLHTVLLDREAERVAVHELAVDGPLTIQSIKLEGAHNPWRGSGAWQLVEARFAGRIHTVIGNLRTGHTELQYQIARTRCFNRRLVVVEHQAAFRGRAVLRSDLAIHGSGSLTVDLVEPIFQVERGPGGKFAEVDDDIDALRRTNANAGPLHRRRYEVAVGCDQPERIGIGASRGHTPREEELIEARRPGVQQAEAVTPGRDLEEWLDLAIHQEFIAQNAIQVEQVEYKVAAVRVISSVGKQQRNVELRKAGQPESGFFVAGVKLIEQAVEPGKALVGVLRREIDAV